MKKRKEMGKASSSPAQKSDLKPTDVSDSPTIPGSPNDVPYSPTMPAYSPTMPGSPNDVPYSPTMPLSPNAQSSNALPQRQTSSSRHDPNPASVQDTWSYERGMTYLKKLEREARDKKFTYAKEAQAYVSSRLQTLLDDNDFPTEPAPFVSTSFDPQTMKIDRVTEYLCEAGGIQLNSKVVKPVYVSLEDNFFVSLSLFLYGTTDMADNIR